jgi:hypothetical protein
MTAMSSLAFLAPAAITLPRQLPSVTSALALLTLGIVNTGLAYWLFYLLIDEAGAATASVITYLMPVAAFLLGVGAAAGTLTIGAIAGLILIALGALLATGRHRQARTETAKPRPCPHDTTAPPPSADPAVPPVTTPSTADSSATSPCATKQTTAKDERRPPVLFLAGTARGRARLPQSAG